MVREGQHEDQDREAAPPYLCGFVKLADLTDGLSVVAHAIFKGHSTLDYVVVIFDDVAARDGGDEFLRLADFALQALPEL